MREEFIINISISGTAPRTTNSVLKLGNIIVKSHYLYIRDLINS